MNVVILAAGQGKRMHSRLPKVLHPLAGKPLLAHVIATARALRPHRVCVVYGHGGDQVPQALAAADLAMVRQEPQLGTGHAVQQALPHLDASARTLVLYGDVPLLSAQTLSGMLAAGGDTLVLLTAELDQPGGYGRIVREAGGAVTRIVEHRDASPAERGIREVNTGIMVIPTARLAGWLAALTNENAQREYYLTDLVRLALADRVAVMTVRARDTVEILGVNSKGELAQLERAHQRRCAERLLEHGVTLADPLRIDVRGSLACGADVRIDVNCVFEGEVSLDDGVEIGANCLLRDTRVGSATRIEPYSFIDGARVGARCRVGPYARIRPGTELGTDVHVGNFVEVKASRFGEGSKANHLSYVGDAAVGRNVNIGAGTITCNFDGANKHQTVIEDDVHIGSDVQLVAPVTVARGTTVGAGTTVWKDTRPGGLVLNTTAQEQRPGWKRPTKSGEPR
ncbi:MAG: bifunctional UDP-N-acetylglucosamine diphosphorylase/glucosamine-1-phosphate N-acetyltransferase GlmU [Burkholderiales bacterium]|nr:bifunctional UDP-N-acetylglucosamine diphosphorylase/glucosamine-1-phosphate N-acetyltransferase GlmU [Burkholderiales bacterium]